MASRKDLLKAQAFTTQRLLASFVNRDPDNATAPLRRVGTATFVGIMIGVVLVAGSAILGRLNLTSTKAWQNPDGAIVADANSGLLFIYYENSEGNPRLLPMADVASARLALGTTETFSVKTDQLQGIEQEGIRGIPDAPRQLPPPSQMNPYPFRTCVTEPDDNANRYITVEVGGQTDEDENQPTTTLEDDMWVLVESESGDQFLVAGGSYHHVPDNTLLNNVVATARTGDGWLSALPAGQPIQPLPISNEGGTPVNRPRNDLVIGSVVMVEATSINPQRYYIQMADGLAETSYVDMAVQLSKQGRSAPITIEAQDASTYLSESEPMMHTEGVPMGAPPGRPDQLPAQPSVCATYLDPAANNGRTTPVITLNEATPDLPKVIADRVPNRAYADYIVVDPLHGALLQESEMGVDEVANGPTFLLTDQRLYGIPDGPARDSLGYQLGGRSSTPVLRVPGLMIRLIAPVDVRLTRQNIYPPLPADLPLPE